MITGRKGHPDIETVDPAHIGTAGKGLKSSDDEALPIIHSQHLAMHTTGEISHLRQYLPDEILREALRAYAREMYKEYKDDHK